MTSTIIKSLLFTIVTVFATVALAATIRNSSGTGGTPMSAVFTDATSLNIGDDVRIAGVKVGSVNKIDVTQDRLAKVSFTVAKKVDLRRGTRAELRFRNLVGQRYISLQPATAGGATLPSSYTFPVSETKPALDLTMLFNGFQPLFQLLNPTDVNNLSEQIIAVFQGEGATVDGLLSSTASLTSTIAEKDQVIGELIDNLGSVLTTVNDRSSQLDTTIITLQQLVSGLSEDRATIGDTIEGLGDLTESVSGLLQESRAPLKKSITSLGTLSTNLSNAETTLDDFFAKLPVKLDAIGRIGSYGSWFNFYVCSIEGRIPMPQGYLGDLGVKPVAGRCH